MANRPPLGLPAGSVRALLTLLIVAVVITRILRGHEPEPLWIETLMIALAHYFTSRRFNNLPPAVVQRLEQEGHMEAEANPLFLPRHSIRLIIVVAFGALAVYLYREQRLLDPRALSILAVVFAYILGVVFGTFLAWWTRGRPSRIFRRWEDIKAAVVLLVMLVTASAYLSDQANLLPPYWRNTTLGLVLFYFGSR